MADKTERSLTSLFRRLCELSFLNEAAKREDAYNRIRYTKTRRKKLQSCLYEKLFSELQAPWVGATNLGENRGEDAKKTVLNVYERIAVKVFTLRLQRQFDKADLLEYYCTEWKALEGSLRSTADVSQSVTHINEPFAILKFLVALSDTGHQESSPLIGYQNELYFTNKIPKEIDSVLPEGPLLNTDSHKLRHQGLLEDQYILYSRDLFESAPTIERDVSSVSKAHSMFPDIMAPGQGRSRFFAIQESGEDKHDKKTRLTVFGALSHGYTNDMAVKLGLPDLTESTDKTFGVSTLPSTESPDDEGFHELSESSASSSQTTLVSHSSADQSAMDIWTEALKLPQQKYYTWEMEGRRDAMTDRPYITEAGPEVFDELYNLISRQVSYLTKTPTHYSIIPIKTLVNHSFDVLIGVPTTTFLNDMDASCFTVNQDIRLSGCSPESLHSTLSKLASIGTNYINLVSFISDKEQLGGLVLHAFLGGLRNYLQCYRAMVLSVDATAVQSPYQLSFIFQSLGKQLRFLSDVCMCSKQSRAPGTSSFPTGVKLLSYLYKLCLDHSSTDHYPVLLSLLKHSCTPYILFVQQWVFQGICWDVYEEFILEVDEQFLAYRDKHFWSHGFVISEQDKLDCVPMFLSELANDIFVCGKSINLIKLCNPGHFLCDSGVPPPKMEVTFSMSKLKAIDHNCTDYVHAMDNIANAVKHKRKLQQRAIEDAKEKALMDERHRAEEALAEVTGLIDQVKKAIDAKKKEDLQMLKEQMEEAIKQRQDDKKQEDEMDNQYMVDALNRADVDEELKERARQELIDYYQKLTEEMDRREEHAQWKIKRHNLNKTRMDFFAQEQVKLEKLQSELALSETTKNEQSNLQVDNESKLNKDLRPEQGGATPGRSVVSMNVPSQRAPVAVPSPSLVSLIASGVKTNALVQSQAGKSPDVSSSSLADSGRGTLGVTHDHSEATTLQSVASLDDGDDTDISVASSISAAVERKTWSKDATTEDFKEQYVSSRRTWEPDDNVRLAEAQLPHGHPSQSSIQFSLYADKKLNVDDVNSSSAHPTPKPGTRNPTDSSAQLSLYGNKNEDTKYSSVYPTSTPGTPNPSDSSIQSSLYGNKEIKNNDMDSSSHSLPQVSIPNPTESSSVSKQVHATIHNPSDSSVQDLIYPSTEKNPTDPTQTSKSTASQVGSLSNKVSTATTESKDLPKDDPVLRDFVRSLSKGVSDFRSGHPSDATFGDFLTENEKIVGPKAKSTFGHPTDSTAQSILYEEQDITSGQRTSQNIQTPSGHRSQYGHPSDSQLDSTDSTPKQTTAQTSRQQRGHPSDTQLDPTLSTLASSTIPHTERNQWGHPSDSQLDPSHANASSTVLPHSQRGQWGHPSDTQLDPSLSTLASSNLPHAERNQWGHPSDSQLDPSHSNETSTIPQHSQRGQWGHPSDTQLDPSLSTLASSNLPHTERNQWGHPSDSKANLLTNSSSLSVDTRLTPSPANVVPARLYPENTRGTPPVDSMRDIIYAVSGDAGPGGASKSTRGHEPAVMITKLMYPSPQVAEPGPAPVKPLVFEDIWVSSAVQPLQVDFTVLDKEPATDLLKSALSAVPIVKDDDDDDDIDAARLMSLPVLLRRSVTAPLVAQISLVNTAVVEYFMEDLNLPRHFEVFRKFLFMEDGEFALSLSDQLFEKVSSGVNPQELCSPTTMNAIVTRAVQLSVYAYKTGFEQRLSFALKSLPDVFNMNDIGTLDFLELRYRVPWPVNIIITENSIIKYNKVFSFMLRLKRVAWVLQEIWFHLKHIGFSRRAGGSPQLRQLQLFRHEMLHFLQNIDGYLSNQILNVTWAEFQQELATNVRDLDDLHHRHTEYLNKAVFRSLLSKKAAPVMKIISDMFSLVLKFRTQLLSCPWKQDDAGGHVVHPRFEVMCATHLAFKEYSGFLFTVLSKLVRRGYQAHLQDFLLRLNFNDFYKTS